MSTLLANAISFRLLIKQLSKNEFLALMSKLFDINQSNLIATSLFNYFVHPPSITNPNISDLNNINSILSEIIQSRKTKQKRKLETTNTTIIKLDTLPKQIIGNMASFLTQNDYFSFQKTNRCIHIGCNSPNMLFELDLTITTDYSPINLSQFKSLKTLKISLCKFNELQLPQNGQLILNELNHLQLFGNKTSDFDIEPFMKQNCINITNIKMIRFNCFGNVTAPFDTNKFWILLTTFKNVDSLIFCSCILHNAIQTEKVNALLYLHPNLKALGVVSGNNQLNNDLIQTFGNNLQRLSLGYPPQPLFDFSNVNFSKLKHVLLTTPSIKTVNDILKSGQNIKEFILFPNGYSIVCPHKEDLKTIIPAVFKCKSLEYFEITVHDENYLQILNGIEYGLFETKRWERNTIKIKMNQ